MYITGVVQSCWVSEVLIASFLLFVLVVALASPAILHERVKLTMLRWRPLLLLGCSFTALFQTVPDVRSCQLLSGGSSENLPNNVLQPIVLLFVIHH